MALNQIERCMLIAARTYLADKRQNRICYAITSAESFMHNTMPVRCENDIKQASKRLRTFIMRAIESHFGLEDWLAKTGVEEHRLFNKEERRAARIAWIDWLLDEPWTEHNGGAQPLLPTEMVIIRKRNGEESGPRPADAVRWEHAAAVPAMYGTWATQYDCVAYKVIYESPNAE